MCRDSAFISPCTCHGLTKLKFKLQIRSLGTVVVISVHPLNDDSRVPNASFLEQKLYISFNLVNCSKQYV